MGNLKENADRLLYDLGLLNELNKYGIPHIIGSYSMDAMAYNDLDIDVSNENMNIEKLYCLSSMIMKKYSPLWYEAKQEKTDEGKLIWFHGFEAMILGELWNVDIWFFDNETIQKAEDFCFNIKMKLDSNSIKKDAVVQIKKDLLSQGLYSFNKYTSMDVYKAVIEDGILSTDEFLLRYTK